MLIARDAVTIKVDHVIHPSGTAFLAKRAAFRFLARSQNHFRDQHQPLR